MKFDVHYVTFFLLILSAVPLCGCQSNYSYQTPIPLRANEIYLPNQGKNYVYAEPIKRSVSLEQMESCNTLESSVSFETGEACYSSQLITKEQSQ